MTANLAADAQALEPGEIVTLYSLDASALGAEVYNFHSYTKLGPITFQGVDYDPWPVLASGFEMSGGASPSPRLRVGNVGGFITSVCLSFDDLIGAILTRHRTFGKYLDGQPEADPEAEYPPEIWFVEQKVGEDREAVDFELSSALNFEGIQLPSRLIIASFCPWQYRGADCGYAGPPVATELDIITTDAESDKCGKRVQSCKMRFGESGELSHGGFPAAGLIR